VSKSSIAGEASPKRSAQQPKGCVETIHETKRHEGRCKRTRALQRKRGDGELFDLIDDWLAPAVARWIANQRSRQSPGEEEK
jgi:hypothetical protein